MPLRPMYTKTWSGILVDSWHGSRLRTLTCSLSQTNTGIQRNSRMECRYGGRNSSYSWSRNRAITTSGSRSTT